MAGSEGRAPPRRAALHRCRGRAAASGFPGAFGRGLERRPTSRAAIKPGCGCMSARPCYTEECSAHDAAAAAWAAERAEHGAALARALGDAATCLEQVRSKSCRQRVESDALPRGHLSCQLPGARPAGRNDGFAVFVMLFPKTLAVRCRFSQEEADNQRATAGAAAQGRVFPRDGSASLGETTCLENCRRH
eukprot:gene13903-biopygen12595